MRIVVLAFAAAVAASQSHALDESNLKTLHGQGDPLCNEVRSRLIAIDSDRFTTRDWRQSFELMNWTIGTRTFTTTQGLTATTPLKFMSVDLDNDGVDEFAVLTVFSVRESDSEWLNVFDETEFRALQDSTDSTRLLYRARKLNVGNFVEFSDGQFAAPNELGLWKWHGQVHLLLKEDSFGLHAYDALGGFFVARFEEQLSENTSDSSRDERLRPQLICRFNA